MRATISFEIDVDKVEETMAALVEQQSHTLRLATNILDSVGKSTLLEEVTEVLDLLADVTLQLQQYRQMLVGFERARFETILPQPVSTASPALSMGDVHATAKKMELFDNFLDKVKKDEDDGIEPEEG